jgi:hypothetical protein
MNEFDAYQEDRLYRLYFGHGDPGDEGRPFARTDVAVTEDNAEHIVGYEAGVFEGRRGSLRDGVEDDDVRPEARIRDKEVSIRKSAIVMKREFGAVDTDVVVTKDKTGRFDVDDVSDGDPIPDGGLTESDLREATTDFFDEADVESVDYAPDRDSGTVVVNVAEVVSGFDGDTFDLHDFDEHLATFGFEHTGYVPAPGMTQVNVAPVDGGSD